jgi:Tfp pilus assembly protein PilZ
MSRRRLNSRFPYRETAWLRAAGLDEFVQVETRNITVGGLFIVGQIQLPIQTEVEVRLKAPDGKLATIHARIVRIVTPQAEGTQGDEAGIGLQFEELSEPQGEAVRAIVEVAKAVDMRPRIPRVSLAASAQRPLADPMLEFMLNHVDGKRTPEALAAAIGLDLDSVVGLIAELQALDVIELVAPPASVAPGAIVLGEQPLLDRISARASGGPHEVERTDLDPTAQAAIDAFIARMADQNHYAVLGLTKTATKEAILPAFVALAHSFGPNAYAGRELGVFLGKLEGILQRIGDAFAALSNERLRQEYDGYLARAEAITKLDAAQAMSEADLAGLADEHAALARYEERHQEWEKAAHSWSKVYEARPDDAHCARRAACALLESKNELRRAQAFAQRALDLEPENPLNHRLLARIFVESGLRLRARKHLQLAAEVEKAAQTRSSTLH